MIRVIIADDHHLVREGIRAILEKEKDIEVIGEAMDGREAVELVLRFSPDVLVIDISMPKLNGLQALEELRSSNTATRVVILSMHSNEMTIRNALSGGAKGYLLKDSVSEELLLAIRAASRGAAFLSPGVSKTLFSGGNIRSEEKAPVGATPLTSREVEILKFISQGLTNNEISERLNISVKTAERHRANLMSKLGANNLVELIRMGIRKGLIPLDE